MKKLRRTDEPMAVAGEKIAHALLDIDPRDRGYALILAGAYLDREGGGELGGHIAKAGHDPHEGGHK